MDIKLTILIVLALGLITLLIIEINSYKTNFERRFEVLESLIDKYDEDVISTIKKESNKVSEKYISYTNDMLQQMRKMNSIEKQTVMMSDHFMEGEYVDTDGINSKNIPYLSDAQNQNQNILNQPKYSQSKHSDSKLYMSTTSNDEFMIKDEKNNVLQSTRLSDKSTRSSDKNTNAKLSESKTPKLDTHKESENTDNNEELEEFEEFEDNDTHSEILEEQSSEDTENENSDDESDQDNEDDEVESKVNDKIKYLQQIQAIMKEKSESEDETESIDITVGSSRKGIKPSARVGKGENLKNITQYKHADLIELAKKSGIKNIDNKPIESATKKKLYEAIQNK